MEEMKKAELRLLVLANIPETGKTVLDWRPFQEGEMLRVVLDEFNEKTRKAFKEADMPPQFWSIIPRSIEPLPYALPDLQKKNEEKDEDNSLDNTKIILVNLDELREIDIKNTKNLLSRYQVVYYLPQISKLPDMKSRKEEFSPLQVMESSPAILTRYNHLLTWLYSLSDFYYVPPSLYPRILQEQYGKEKADEIMEWGITSGNLEKTLLELRAIWPNEELSEEQVQNRVRMASFQDSLLFELGEKIKGPGTRLQNIILDNVRQSVSRMPIKFGYGQFSTKKTDMVKISLSKPMSELSIEQKQSIRSMGITSDEDVAVYFSHPTAWANISRLQGLIEATKFSANMPNWDV